MLEVHIAALHALAEHDGVAHTGLAQAARKAGLPSALKKKLVNIDAAAAILRHITPAHVRALMDSLHSQLRSPSCAVGADAARADLHQHTKQVQAHKPSEGQQLEDQNAAAHSMLELLEGLALQRPSVAGGILTRCSTGDHSMAPLGHHCVFMHVHWTPHMSMIARAEEAAWADEWARNPVVIPNGSIVDFRDAYSTVRRRGCILRAGYAQYEDYYRMLYDPLGSWACLKDQWVHRSLCASVLEDEPV